MNRRTTILCASLVMGLAGRAAVAQFASLTLSRDVALWSDNVVARIDVVGCNGPASQPFVQHSPQHLIDIDLEDCSSDFDVGFTHFVELGPLFPTEYTVRVFDAIRHVVSPPPPPFDTAPLSVHRDADLRAEVPDVLRSGAVFTVTLRGPARSPCHLTDGPLVAGNVIAVNFYDECPILPPPGPAIVSDSFAVGPLPAGDYEIRLFEFESEHPAMSRRPITVRDEHSCAPSASALCLGGGRFRVEATWEDFSDGTGTGKAAALADRDDSGLFWFFAEDNIELTVKVLNGCGVNGHHWVFVSSGSTVRWTVTVTDTLTLASRTYDNALGEAAPLAADTSAFSCGAP